MSLDKSLHFIHDLKEEDKNNILFVQALIKEFEQSSRIREISYEDPKFSVRVVLHEPQKSKDPLVIREFVPQQATIATVQTLSVSPKIDGKPISSPMVGIAYLAPRPEAEPFVTVGQEVKQGQILLLVSAMKVMNSITSPFNGRVVHITVKDGAPVEFGEELLRIEEV